MAKQDVRRPSNPKLEDEVPARRTSRRLEFPFKYLNPIMRRVLESPLHRGPDARLMVLRYQGRRTGRLIALPVSYVSVGNSLLVPGGGSWKHNFDGGREATLVLKGRHVPVVGSLITDPGEVESALITMQRANPAVRRFVGVGFEDGRPIQADLARALTNGFAVVRFERRGQGPTGSSDSPRRSAHRSDPELG